jgi:serine/threonine protein phosphatase 1
LYPRAQAGLLRAMTEDSDGPVYAIGDIHGQLGRLEEALALIERDGGAAAPLVFLGDYVDRGAESRAVIETFLAGLAAGRDWSFVKGNHDRMFERFLDSGTLRDGQIASGKLYIHPNIGGAATLQSYFDLAGRFGLDAEAAARMGVEGLPEPLLAAVIEAARAAVPESHRAFLRELPLYLDRGRWLFVHAGIRPGLPMAEQEEEDLLWIRGAFHRDSRDHGALIVHGHTPVDWPERHPNRLNLDTGAGYGRALVPVVLEGAEVFALTARGRQPL